VQSDFLVIFDACHSCTVGQRRSYGDSTRVANWPFVPVSPWPSRNQLNASRVPDSYNEIAPTFSVTVVRQILVRFYAKLVQPTLLHAFA